jgi:hypothetical protein
MVSGNGYKDYDTSSVPHLDRSIKTTLNLLRQKFISHFDTD